MTAAFLPQELNDERGIVPCPPRLATVTCCSASCRCRSTSSRATLSSTASAICFHALLADVLADKGQPANPPERAELANFAQQPYRALYARAVALYAEAFAARPRLVPLHRYNAACAAALAGTGQGKDAGKLHANARAHLRYAALSWLQSELSAHATRLGEGPEAAAASRQALLHWQRDADLAAVRDRDLLARLPEAEQAAWANLWGHVAALLAR